MVGSHRRESRVWLSVQPGPHKLLSHHTALHVSQENWGLLMCVLLVGLLLPRMALGTGHLRRHSLRLPSSAGARTLWFASAPVTVSSTRPNPKEPRTVHMYMCSDGGRATSVRPLLSSKSISKGRRTWNSPPLHRELRRFHTSAWLQRQQEAAPWTLICRRRDGRQARQENNSLFAHARAVATSLTHESPS